MPEMDAAGNAPPWELPPILKAGRATPAGYFAYLAPLSRHIRLIPELLNGGVAVKSVHITQGIGYETTYEPMYHWKEKANEPDHWYPSGLRSDKALWRDSGALFAFSELAGSNEEHRPWAFRQFHVVQQIYRERSDQPRCRCQSYGIANDQANPILWRVDSLDFPKRLLGDADLASLLAHEIELAEFLGSSLNYIVKQFAAGILSGNPAPKDISNFVMEIGIEPVYWASLELPFKLFLSRIDDEESLREWRAHLEACAREAFARCLDPSTAATGRRYEAYVSCEGRLNRILAKELKLD
jgi:CRISPR type I-E-associated protein CasA/Cse1